MNKTDEVYRKLQKHLDKMPIGFPETKSGVEIRLLKQLYTPEEAKIASKLTIYPERIKNIFKRVKKMNFSKEELKQHLENMDKKGAILGKQIGKRKYYRITKLIIGMYEFQVNRITKEFMEDMHQYIEEAYADELFRAGIHQVRIIPVEISVSREPKVYLYDDLRKLVKKSRGPFGVAKCVCRIGHDLLRQSCKKTNLRESCLVFQKTAKYYIEHQYARPITKKQVFELLKKAEDEGLVLQPGATQRLDFICTCCGCCCEGLKLAKKLSQPARVYLSTYKAKIDGLTCIGCKRCINRCQINAISIVNDVASVDKNYCIGCGLCVVTCPSQAIMLIKKEKMSKTPKSSYRLHLIFVKAKFGRWKVIKEILKLITSLKLYYLLKK